MSETKRDQPRNFANSPHVSYSQSFYILLTRGDGGLEGGSVGREGNCRPMPLGQAACPFFLETSRNAVEKVGRRRQRGCSKRRPHALKKKKKKSGINTGLKDASSIFHSATIKSNFSTLNALSKKQKKKKKSPKRPQPFRLEIRFFILNSSKLQVAAILLQDPRVLDYPRH